MRENEQIVKVVQVKEIKRLPESVVNRVAAGEVLLYSFSLFFFFVFFLLLKRLVFLGTPFRGNVFTFSKSLFLVFLVSFSLFRSMRSEERNSEIVDVCSSE